jgi:hypothetical protein
MKLSFIIFVLTFVSIFFQIVLACTTPIVYNEYGVPISFYGGILTINGSKYPSNQKIITYNLTVNNTNKFNSITLTLTPSSDLLNYVYGSTVTVPARWKGSIGINVYVDGLSKGGDLYVDGHCDNGLPIPEGVIYVSVIGRGNSNPQFCGNTKTSCGVYPDCRDLSNLDGCYDGYKRTYYCAGNTVQYSKVCTSYCCQSFTEDGYCTGNPSSCFDPTPSCKDECGFEGTKCMNNSVYTCMKKEDGCNDLIQLDDCGAKSFNCYNSQCINGSAKIGSIAYLCSNTNCNEGLESSLISWLDYNDWMVVGRAFNSWDSRELDEYDVILCSDEIRACKVDSKYASNDLHNNHKKPFVEIADTREAQGAWRFGYVKNPYELIATGDSLYVTKTDDSIFFGIDQNPQIFSFNKKMTVVPDYNLNSVIDLADVETNNKKSTLFKLDEEGNRGRYAYIGWFYQSLPSDLTEEGIKILNRTLLWSACGDTCLLGSIGNLPPVALAMITPNPTGYEGQTILFDASNSYDPEGENLSYNWNFGDGTNSGWISDKTTTHAYTKKGEYNITLIVNDGELNSKPSIKLLKILPAIKNKVAFVCGDISCSGSTEQEIIQFLTYNGFTVGKGTEYSWNYNDLSDYDFMICTSSTGCSIHLKSSVYNAHVNDKKGFLEIPDYIYARAANTFKYVSWYVGTRTAGTDISFIGNHPITKDLSENILRTSKDMNGIFTSSVKVPTIAKLNSNKDISTMFVYDGEGNRGRYAYIGWFNRDSVSDLTDDGKTMLLRTVRWVQCGNVEGC